MLNKIRLKTTKPFVFLRGEVICRYEQVPEAGGRLMEGVEKLLHEQNIRPAGPALWAYTPAGPGKVRLRVGYPVKAGTRGEGKISARKEPEWKCLSGEYTGAMPQIISAWQELMAAADKKGLRQTGSRREIYRKWVGMDSKENVTELELRVR